MTEPTSHVERAVAERIAAARRREAEKQQQREELAAAREKGLGYRHAQKLARSQQDPANAPEENPMPAAIRRTVCPACRQQRPARLVTTLVVTTSRYDVLKCLDEACGLLWCAPPNRPRTALPVPA